MTRLLTVCLIVLVWCDPGLAEDTLPEWTPEKPNVVIILADDLGRGDLNCYNPHAKTITPATDRLADASVVFDDAHTPSSVCTPTRYGVLTGRYAWRSRLKNGVTWGYSRSLIEPGRMTIASMLKQNGYRTACIGKWHLGLQSPDLKAKDLPPASATLPKDHAHAVDYSQPLTPGPNSLGFDYFFGIPASLDMEPYVFVENDRPIELPTAMVEKSLHRRQKGGGFWRAGPIAPSFKHIDVLPKVTQKAVAWIGQQNKEQPFFLYLPLPAPHTPWLPTKRFQGTSQAGYYGDFVNQVDHSIGQVLTALQKHNLTQNTLVVVTSDNGAHWPEADIVKWKHAANRGTRGQKADIWEGGHRVPMLISWPNHLICRRRDDVVCLTDLFATVAEIIGYELPPNVAEDSFSMLSKLRGENSLRPIRKSIVHHSLNGTFAIRVGEWKLIVDNLGSGGFTGPQTKKPAKDGPQGQLYNLFHDPLEKSNLYEANPDVVKRLRNELRLLQKAGRSR